MSLADPSTTLPRPDAPSPASGSRSAALALARRRRRAFRAIGVLAILAAGLAFVMAASILSDHSDDPSRREVTATRALIEAGRRVRDQVGLTLERSVGALREFANDPAVRAALRSGDRTALTEACNAAVRCGHEVDAVALFDASGAIVAINTVYGDGSAIPAGRVERVMGTEFAARRIINGCLTNRASTEVLEFQTDCDITPAFFDSSGLAVACSAPVMDEDGTTQRGVVSLRLRFERIAAIADALPVAHGEGEVRFVTDAGRIFDEAVNAGRVAPPMPTDELRALVAPLVVEGKVHSFVQRDDGFIGLFRMDRFRTLSGGGIQVIVSLPNDWVVRQSERERLLEAAVPGFFGLLLVAVGIANAMLAALIAKRAKLRELSERYEAAVAGTSDGLWEWEIESDALWTSPRCRELLGEPAAGGGGTLRWSDLLERTDGTDREALKAAVEALLAHGCAIDVELRIRSASGGERWFRLRGDAERSVDRGRRIAGSIEDVTQLRRAVESLRAARAEAEAANRSKSEFLANMSHEIRTPMTAILGFTELLASEGDRAIAPQRRLEYIETIQRNGEHLLSIINDILDLSKIEAGRMTVESIDCDLAKIVGETLDLMAVKAKAKGLALSASFETAVPAFIRSDPVRLRQVLVNLIGNAIKFTESGAVRVAVAIDREDRALLRFDVIDSGIGLTESQRSRLFGTFVQADASITRRFGGTGLGLRISKRLAQMLGGDITVESQPGRGSTFSLVVRAVLAEGTAWIEAGPCAPNETRGDGAQRHAIGGAPDAEPPLRGLRILLAEDGPDNVRLIRFHLEKAGATVESVEHGGLALGRLTSDGTMDGRLLHPAPFDLLLTDMQMPELDGYALAAILRSRGSRLPIIALTAHAMAGERERCVASGCDAYASKPVDPPALIALCRSVLAPSNGADRRAA